MAFLFENLEVYKKAVGFAKDVQQSCKGIKSGNHVVVDQLQRASLSVATNIAEGNGRWHKKDRAHFFVIARGSAFECVPLLEICRDMGLVPKDKVDCLRFELESIGRMLTMLIKGVENRTSSWVKMWSIGSMNIRPQWNTFGTYWYLSIFHRL